MKKYLLMLLAAFAVVTTSFTFVSCSDDEDTPTTDYYTLEPIFDYQGFSDQELALLEQLKVLKPVTQQMSEFQARQIVETGMTQMENLIVQMQMPQSFKSGQKLTITYKLYKGRTASGTPILTKTIVVTKDGISKL